jgi:metal-sulfur cluster biosynthetic enzyme
MEEKSIKLKEAILASLQKIIDPETNVSVIRMRLIQDLVVDHLGHVSYTFRPSSALCPIALFLAIKIKAAVASVDGVKSQNIAVIDYVGAEALTELINQDDMFNLNKLMKENNDVSDTHDH